MMLRLFLLITLLALPASAATPRQTAVNQTLEVEALLVKNEITWIDLMRLAELASPALSAARNSVEIQAARSQQAEAYPNPTLGLGIGEMSTNDRGDRKEKVSLAQSLIVGGRRGAAVEAARAEHESAISQALNIRREVLLSLQSLWLKEFHHREKDEAFLELMEVANQTLGIAETRFDARAAPESQVTRALLDVFDLEVGRQELALEKSEAKAELMALLGGVAISVDRFSRSGEDLPEVTADLLQLDKTLGNKSDNLSSHLSDHPALTAAKHSVDAAKASLHQAKAERIPDLDLFLAYGRNRGADDNFVEAGISLPLPLFNRNQGKIAAQRSNVALARDRALLLENELQNQFAVSRQYYLNARGQLEITANRILPAAQRGLEQAQEGYRVGRVPFLELMDAQRILATVRLRSIELRLDLALAEAQMMSLVGAGPYAK